MKQNPLRFAETLDSKVVAPRLLKILHLKLYLCDEYKNIHRITLSRFLYFQQIRIKTGH